MCQAFSLFLLDCEKTHPKFGQWKIFVVASEVNMSLEKYFEFLKSLTYFDSLISEEHFGQVSLKSGKSTYPINSLEDGEFAQKQKPCFRPCNIFRVFARH